MIEERLKVLRQAMRAKGVDAYIIPNCDPHLSEYPPERWRARRWISGFTGSAGTAVITLNRAALWSDSRYFLQAEKELDGSEFIFFKEGIVNTPDIYEWLYTEDIKGGVLGIDETAVSYAEGTKITEIMRSHGISTSFDFNPLDSIWTNRPDIPDGEVIVYDAEKYAGESFSEKRSRILEVATKNGCDALLLTALDDVAWCLNIRGTDVAFNPVVVAYAYVSKRENVIFIDKAKIGDSARKYFESCNIKIAPYHEVWNYLGNIPDGEKVLADPARINYKAGKILDKKEWCREVSPVPLMKSIKNRTEIDGTKRALLRDGVAMVNFLCWIDDNIGRIKIDELSAAKRLYEFRKEQPLFFSESFSTISGYAAHGAIVHYSASSESNAILKREGFLLVDSGGQYLDGTTDITRTIPLGMLTAEEKRNFTLVLKGHIAIATAQFPEGTRGSQLDVLARLPLWLNGLSYLHGTGHGIGHFLNVHEGPQNIRLEENPSALRPGMITSDEPGVYIEGKYGIRIENMTLVEERLENEFGKFYGFEILTLCPIDTRALDVDLLSEREIGWINAYHRRVFDALCRLVGKRELEWLKERCSAVGK